MDGMTMVSAMAGAGIITILTGIIMDGDGITTTTGPSTIITTTTTTTTRSTMVTATA